MTTTTLFGIYLAPLYAAIAQVESDNGKTSDNVYQLTRVYVSDCNRITGGTFDPVQQMWRGGEYDFHDRDRYLDRTLPEKMMFLYWRFYGREVERRGIRVTPEILANIHRYGYTGAMQYHDEAHQRLLAARQITLPKGNIVNQEVKLNVVQFGKFRGMRELALFAGAGGGILGGKMLGWRTVCAVEIEDYPRRVLLQRQRDGIFDPFPIWDDVCTFDGKPWRGRVDVISGGFPCQDISSAGTGGGIEHGARSGLWREYARIIRDVRPRYCFVENSPMLTSRGLGIVLGDLAALRYDAAWRVLSAEDCGAPHKRDRMWIVGKDAGRRDVLSHAELHGSGRREQFSPCLAETNSQKMANADEIGLQRGEFKRREKCELHRFGNGSSHIPNAEDGWDVRRIWSMGADGQARRGRQNDGRGASFDWGWEWWKAEPGLGRVADGVADRSHRLKAIGNGQVPIVAARAFSELYDEINRRHG